MNVLCSQLISQVRDGNTSVIKGMIADKTDVNVFIDGVSPLMVAIEKDDCAQVLMLLGAKADPDRIASQKCSPLRYAVRTGSLSVTEMFISQGDSASIHAIIEAASHGRRDVLRVLHHRYNQENMRTLLRRLPSLLQPDENPQHREIVDMLITECASEINEGIGDGFSPLEASISASSGYYLNALINAGAEVPQRDKHRALMLLLDQGYNDIAKKLFSSDPSRLARQRDDRGRTALYVAGTVEMVDMVLSVFSFMHEYQMGWINARRDAETSALAIAIEKASIPMISRLLAAGARYIPDVEGFADFTSADGYAIAHMLMDAYFKDETILVSVRH